MSAIELLDRGVELLAFLLLHQQLRYLFTPLDVLDGLNTSPRAEGEVQLAAVIEDQHTLAPYLPSKYARTSQCHW